MNAALRSPLTTSDLIQIELVPVDEAMRASEVKWGVGRLVRLIEPETLARWTIGYDRWNAAIEGGDLAAVRDLAPKILQALAVMDRKATAAGHAELATTAFEAVLEDGRVLCVVRTAAEAHSLVLGPSGREMVVWSMDELVLALPKLEMLHSAKMLFPGAKVQALTPRGEGHPHRFVTDRRMREIQAEDLAALRATWREPV